MPAFQINDAEWQALVEEPGDIFLAYCSIRRFMDYETGIAGARRRLSEQMIREVLYVAPTRGRHESGSPTRQRIRSVLDRLITLDVIRPIGPMVYQLPLATRDGLPKGSATDQQPHQQPYQQPTDNQTEAPNDEAFSDSDTPSATVSESADSTISNLPPVSGNPPTTLCAHDDFADARQRFAMHDDWMPTAKGWKATAVRNGLANTPFNPEALLEFRSYWINRPDKHQTQGQWEHDLAQSIKRGVRHDQSNPGRSQAQAGARTGRQGSVSAVDKVRNAIAERKAREAAAGAAGQALDEDGGDVRPPLDVEFWHHG